MATEGLSQNSIQVAHMSLSAYPFYYPTFM